MDVRPIKWLLYLTLSWRFLPASCQTTGSLRLLPPNLTACQTYNIDVSGIQGTLPFSIAISTYSTDSVQMTEEWSMNGIEAAVDFPIFFFPGTDVTLSVSDDRSVGLYAATLQVSGDAREAACASSSNATSTALASNLTAAGPCNPTNIQWENKDTSDIGLTSDIIIETLNLVQNINHTLLSVSGTSIITQVRMPPGVEYRVLVSESGEQIYSASGPLVVQNIANTTCLANNYNPPINTTVSITNSTTASLPIITDLFPDSDSDPDGPTDPGTLSKRMPLILGLSIPLLLVSLLCISLCIVCRHARNRPKRDLPSSISGIGLVTQLATLNLMRREETDDAEQDQEEYRDELLRGDYLVVTAHDDARS